MFGLIKEIDNSLAVDTQNRTYTTLGYANGPGGMRGPRPDLRNVDTADKEFRQQATVLLRSETHGSEDVGKNLDLLIQVAFNSLFSIIKFPYPFFLAEIVESGLTHASARVPEPPLARKLDARGRTPIKGLTLV